MINTTLLITLDTTVISKYEVDEGYLLIDGNNLPSTQLRAVLKSLPILTYKTLAEIPK